MDRTRFEKADQQCHKTRFQVESTGEKKEGRPKNTSSRNLEADMEGNGLS